MQLVENMMEECTFMERIRTPDGAGGWHVEWREGSTFLAHIKLSNSDQMRIAEREGSVSNYTISTLRDMPLQEHDVFKRNRDGKNFRVTGDGKDQQSPGTSQISLSIVQAEKWELTT